jgi:hypothetical protein
MIRPKPPMSPRSEETIIQKTTHSFMMTMTMRKPTFIDFYFMISGNCLKSRIDYAILL